MAVLGSFLGGGMSGIFWAEEALKIEVVCR